MKTTASRMRSLAPVLLGLIILFQHSNALALINWNGTWTGSFNDSGTLPCGSYFSTSGDVTVDITVSDGVVSGTESYSGLYCYDPDTCEPGGIGYVFGTISGSVSGNSISWTLDGTINGSDCDGEPEGFTYSGTLSGQTITGSGGPCSQLTATSAGMGEPPTPPTPPDPTSWLNGPPNTPPNPGIAEPISVATGNMFYEITDYTTAGANPLNFTRYYNSLADSNSAAITLGTHWRCNYDRYLRAAISNNVTYVVAERPSGQEVVFNNSGTAWVTDSNEDVQLTQSGSVWTLTDSDDTQETYNWNGGSSPAQVTSIQCRNGYTQTLQYNGTGQLTSVTDSFGRTLQFAYSGGALLSVTSPSGLVVTYGYTLYITFPSNTATHILNAASYSTSPSTSQFYSYGFGGTPGLLAGITDENGQPYAAWSYTPAGLATMSLLGTNANLTTITYNGDGSRTVTSPLGLVTIYKFGAQQNVPMLAEIDRAASGNTPAASLTQSYDANGYLADTIDWNTNQTSMVNDLHGQPTLINEGVGTPQARTTTISYLTNFHLPRLIVAPGKTIQFVYDTNGNQLSRTEIDTSSNRAPYSTTGTIRIWTNTFDALGHILTATGPRADVAAYAYDASNDLASLGDPLGHTTIFTNYNRSGLPLTKIDPNGVITRYTYDVRDRLLTRIVLAASGNATNRFGYDAVGQLVSATLPDGSALYYQYDSAHRLQSITNTLGETITYFLDGAGDITNELVRGVTGSVTRTHTRVFDALGRVLQEIGAASQTTTYDYDADGNRISITDANQNRTLQAFDALNRLIAAVDPLTNAVLYGMDAQDCLTNVTDPRTLTTTYVHDGFGRVIQETSPDQGTIVYQLDPEGNRTNEVDARGVVTRRTFDKLNRVTAEMFPTSPGENIAYTYDATSNGNFGIGRLTGYTDQSGSTALTYNERGDTIAAASVIGGTSYITAYGYDLADHLTNLIYPSGHVIVYTRDSQGRIGSVTFKVSVGGASVPLATNVTYLPFGPISGFRYGNGLVRTMSYDQDYRLTGINTVGATNIQSLQLAYDPANNIIAITNGLGIAFNQGFAYDPDYRLTQATGIYGSLAYSYDADGNRLTRTAGGITESYSYPSNANLLLSTAKSGVTRHFTYTTGGNLTTDDRGTATNLMLGYGSRNRYQALSLGGTTVATYQYNALGERVSKTVNGITTQYQYDKQNHLIAESQGNGTLIREYVWLDDMPLAQIESNGTIYYLHPDHLNTPQEMTDANQTVVWNNAPQPFGESSLSVGSSSPGSASPAFLAQIGWNTNRQFQFAVNGDANTPYVVQKNSDLTSSNWQPVATNNAPFVFAEAPGSPNRFYRAAFIPGLVSSGPTLNLRFPGQYFDVESGLNYNLMRDYDPTLGRYLEHDILDNYYADNKYVYAANAPTLNTDNKGLYVVDGADLPPDWGQAVVDAASQWKGTDYAPASDSTYSGPGAQKGTAADCSGSVYAIYSNLGLPYDYEPTWSLDQMAQQPGFPLRKLNGNESLQPGDIVLYNHHMGIYDGNNSVWAAHRAGFQYDQFKLNYFGNPIGYYRYQLPTQP